MSCLRSAPHRHTDPTVTFAVVVLVLQAALAPAFAALPPFPAATPHAGTGLRSSPAWMTDGDQTDCRFGTVAPAGDVNGDGFDDVATGAPYRDEAFVDAGRARVFYGCPDAGAGVEPDLRVGAALAVVGANPTSRSTAFSFLLARPGPARLVAYDLAGRRVAVLYEGNADAGTHRVEWRGRSDDGAALPAGVYLVRLEAGAATRSVKVEFLR